LLVHAGLQALIQHSDYIILRLYIAEKHVTLDTSVFSGFLFHALSIPWVRGIMFSSCPSVCTWAPGWSHSLTDFCSFIFILVLLVIWCLTAVLDKFSHVQVQACSANQCHFLFQDCEGKSPVMLIYQYFSSSTPPLPVIPVFPMKS